MTTTELKLEKNKARAEKTLTKNVIQFKKRFINLNQVSDNSENYLLAMTIASELMQFGFILDKSGIPVASSDINGLLEAIKPYCELPKFSVYDLLVLHVKNRGSIVESKEDADKVLNFGDFSESYVGILEYMGI